MCIARLEAGLFCSFPVDRYIWIFSIGLSNFYQFNALWIQLTKQTKPTYNAYTGCCLKMSHKAAETALKA